MSPTDHALERAKERVERVPDQYCVMNSVAAAKNFIYPGDKKYTYADALSKKEMDKFVNIVAEIWSQPINGSIPDKFGLMGIESTTIEPKIEFDWINNKYTGSWKENEYKEFFTFIAAENGSSVKDDMNTFNQIGVKTREKCIENILILCKNKVTSDNIENITDEHYDALKTKLTKQFKACETDDEYNKLAIEYENISI